MPLVIVERENQEAQTFADLQAAEQEAAPLMAEHSVVWVRSYLSLDHTRLVSMYEAPSLEAVETFQRSLGNVCERVYLAKLMTQDDS